MSGRYHHVMMLAAILLVGTVGCSSTQGRTTTLVPEPTATAAVSTPTAEVPTTAAVVEEATGVVDLAPVEPRLVLHGSRDERVVALTFDLCERDNDRAGFQRDIIDYLVAEDLPATFFMGGKWARSHPQEARVVADVDDFEIGNHSWSHVHMTEASTEDARRQVLDAQEEIFAATGRTATLFRFPYGESDDDTLRVVGDAGLVSVGWDADTGDPDKNQTPRVILTDVRRHLKPGSIILMHANGRGWHTREALPLLVDHLREAGYSFATVSELLAEEE